MGGKHSSARNACREGVVFWGFFVCVLFFNDGSMFVNDLVETQIVFMGTSDIGRQDPAKHLNFSSVPSSACPSPTCLLPNR